MMQVVIDIAAVVYFLNVALVAIAMFFHLLRNRKPKISLDLSSACSSKSARDLK
jgi:hypothetical protein